MVGKKIVFIVPGYKHLPTNRAYKEIAKILRSEGHLPVPIAIPWKQTTISENTEYFLQKFKRRLLLPNSKISKKYILGFSYGAMIAFLASTKVRVSGLILCSLSPYFKEDLPKVNNCRISSLKLQRYKEFSKLHNAALAKKIKAKKIHMLYGSKEERSLIKRVIRTFDQIPSRHKYLIRIKKTVHNIGDKRYLDEIHQIARELN